MSDQVKELPALAEAFDKWVEENVSPYDYNASVFSMSDLRSAFKAGARSITPDGGAPDEGRMVQTAFPTHGANYDHYFSSPGMTLRDYFAAKAMQGLLSGIFRDSGNWNFKELPQEAYAIADAMLAERAKVQP